MADEDSTYSYADNFLYSSDNKIAAVIHVNNSGESKEYEVTVDEDGYIEYDSCKYSNESAILFTCGYTGVMLEGGEYDDYGNLLKCTESQYFGGDTPERVHIYEYEYTPQSKMTYVE